MTYHSLTAFVKTLLLQVICSSSFSGAFVSTTPLRRNGIYGIKPSIATTGLAASSVPVVVALTREDGKNTKLVKQIQQECELRSQLELLELPCIEHADGPDYNKLAETLLSKSWDYIAVTSPEAARVLSSAWDVVRENPLPVAAVGKATEKCLREAGIPVAFVPSKATAATLAEELELKSGEGTSLLYPASALAKDTLESGLTSRGFDVTRLNTYDTVTAKWSAEFKDAASQVQIACFASPSSVKGWLKNTENNNNVLAACIGETSATACKELGWEESMVFFPENPGLEGWVESIRHAMEETKRVSRQMTSSDATK
jgi:uroporphyrinogen-III synthase